MPRSFGKLPRTFGKMPRTLGRSEQVCKTPTQLMISTQEFYTGTRASNSKEKKECSTRRSALE
jgi:hypothetical protein